MRHSCLIFLLIVGSLLHAADTGHVVITMQEHKSPALPNKLFGSAQFKSELLRAANKMDSQRVCTLCLESTTLENPNSIAHLCLNSKANGIPQTGTTAPAKHTVCKKCITSSIATAALRNLQCPICATPYSSKNLTRIRDLIDVKTLYTECKRRESYEEHNADPDNARTQLINHLIRRSNTLSADLQTVTHRNHTMVLSGLVIFGLLISMVGILSYLDIHQA